MTGHGQPQDAPAPLRADARRNREQILEAARTLFAEVGLDVPMDEIARAAGVGVGTLYRRFPDRDELIKAVSLDDFDRLLVLARRVEHDEADPAAALFTLLRSAVELRLGYHVTALSSRAYRAIQDSPALVEHRDEVVTIADRLLRRAQQRGDVRADIAIGDTLMMMSVLSRLSPLSGDDLGEMVFRRLSALMLDSLHTGPASTLPGRPISDDDVDRLRRRGQLTGLAKRPDAASGVDDARDERPM